VICGSWRPRQSWRSFTFLSGLDLLIVLWPAAFLWSVQIRCFPFAEQRHASRFFLPQSLFLHNLLLVSYESPAAAHSIYSRWSSSHEFLPALRFFFPSTSSSFHPVIGPITYNSPGPPSSSDSQPGRQEPISSIFFSVFFFCSVVDFWFLSPRRFAIFFFFLY